MKIASEEAVYPEATPIQTGNTMQSRAGIKHRMTLRISLFVLCTLLAGVTQAAVMATVDRNSMTEFELVRLTIRITGESLDNPPDYSSIEKDFEIINTQSRKNSSISIVNGRQTSNVHTDYVLTLRAKRLGQLTIPPIRVGREMTSAIPIQVLAQSKQVSRRMNQLVFFETSVDTRSTYVQGQILYTVKLFYSESISGDFPPPPKIEDAVVETIETEKRYESIVNNRRYYVLEKRYAIFPQRSGVITIPRETFLGSRGRGGLFSSRQRVNAISGKHVISVKTIPASFDGDNWIPAVQLTLSESWAENPPLFRVGEPVNRILRITVNGLASSLLPPFAELDLVNAKTYADPPESIEQASAEGISSTNMTTIGIVPIEAGQLILPEIRVPWWNTRTDKLEVAILPQASYEVLPAIGGVTVAPVVPGPVLQPVLNASPQTITPVYWMAAAAVLGLLLLFTSWQWRVTRLKLETALAIDRAPTGPAFESPDEVQAFKDLIDACRSNDALKAHRSLFLWGIARFPFIDSTIDLVRLTGRDDFASCARDLEQALYSPGKQNEWQGDDLLKLVTEIGKTKPVVNLKSALIDTLNPV